MDERDQRLAAVRARLVPGTDEALCSEGALDDVTALEAAVDDFRTDPAATLAAGEFHLERRQRLPEPGNVIDHVASIALFSAAGASAPSEWQEFLAGIPSLSPDEAVLEWGALTFELAEESGELRAFDRAALLARHSMTLGGPHEGSSCSSTCAAGDPMRWCSRTRGSTSSR